jgi:hypothetical protein
VQLQQVLPALEDLKDLMSANNYADVVALSKAAVRADGALTAIKAGFAMREAQEGR